jgi:hypothetical protein
MPKPLDKMVQVWGLGRDPIEWLARVLQWLIADQNHWPPILFARASRIASVEFLPFQERW